MSAREVRRQTCNESRPWSDRLLIKPSERAEPASPPAIDGHINARHRRPTSTGVRSRVTQESRPQPRRHQLCQPAPGQPPRALQVTQCADLTVRARSRGRIGEPALRRMSRDIVRRKTAQVQFLHLNGSRATIGAHCLVTSVGSEAARLCRWVHHRALQPLDQSIGALPSADCRLDSCEVAELGHDSSVSVVALLEQVRSGTGTGDPFGGQACGGS